VLEEAAPAPTPELTKEEAEKVEKIKAKASAG